MSPDVGTILNYATVISLVAVVAVIFVNYIVDKRDEAKRDAKSNVE